jgi:threonyl-tRNA synthetase
LVSYCEKFLKELKFDNLRPSMMKEKTLNYRIRSVYKRKIPYYLVIGKKEMESNEIILIDSFSGERRGMQINEISKYLLEKEKN